MEITLNELNESYKAINELDKEGSIVRGFLVEMDNGLWFSFDEKLGTKGAWVMVSPDVEVIDLD
jgi:hypothetical protein